MKNEHEVRNTILDTEKDRLDFKRLVVYSMVLHVAVALFFGVKSWVAPEEPYMLDQAIRVDMVALPDKIKQPPALAPAPVVENKKEAPAPKKPELPKAKEPPKVAPKTNPLKPDSKKAPVKDDKADAINRIKALEKIEEQVQKENAEKQAQSKAQQKTIKGNVLSAGTSLRGLNKLDYETYLSELDRQVKSHWSLPEWLASGKLKARVFVTIDDKGYVTGRKILNSSGDSNFDGLALQAIDDASPFPAPPNKFVDIVGVRGIVFGFPE